MFQEFKHLLVLWLIADFNSNWPFGCSVAPHPHTRSLSELLFIDYLFYLTIAKSSAQHLRPFSSDKSAKFMKQNLFYTQTKCRKITTTTTAAAATKKGEKKYIIKYKKNSIFSGNKNVNNVAPMDTANCNCDCGCCCCCCCGSTTSADLCISHAKR